MVLTLILVISLWVICGLMIFSLSYEKTPNSFPTQCFIAGIAIVETIILIVLQLCKN